MNKVSVCIETVLDNIDFYDRIKVAAELGFDAFEFWEVETRDIAKVARLSSENNIPVAVCCAKDTRATDMSYPSAVVIRNIEESTKILKELGFSSMIVLAGDLESKHDSKKNIIIENLKRVADIAVRENVVINIEPLNSLVDHKGYYLDSSSVGFEIVKCVNCPNIKLLFDIYHMQIMEGNIIESINRNVDLIGHIHIAGVPGRCEAFKGENNYPYILKKAIEAGYDKYFGLEYYPTYDSVQSLKDVKEHIESSLQVR
jgi:hydroxypyruvate isomerase